MSSDEQGHGRPAMVSPPDRQVVDDMLRLAVAAPSLHNSQPWRFAVKNQGSTIELLADQARFLPVADRNCRAAHIACGAALFNLRLAATVANLRPSVRLMPDPDRPLLMAEIELSTDSVASANRATASERALWAAIPMRRTDREPYSDRAVPPGIRAELAQAATAEGANLRFLGQDEAARLLRLAAEAERELFGDPAYRAELANWVGMERETDGIPVSMTGSRSPEGRDRVRDFATHPGQQPRYAWFEESPQLAVLSVRAGGPKNWLIAGQALECAWLTATSRGISVCPMTQPLETADAWLVQDHYRGSGKPQMIIRIGYGLPSQQASPRRPLCDVVHWQ
jgi:nitroreductase